MDLSKFLSLLQTKTFWMSRADFLGDPFDGSITNPMLAARAAQKEFADILPKLAESTRYMVSSHYISCWHGNDTESAAMWKLYSKSDEAVCIQSTFDTIAGALPASMHGGSVAYIDYEKDAFDPGNGFNYVMHKRRSFAHEHEYRFAAWDLLASKLGGDEIRARKVPGGLAWPLEPSAYIQAVYVSPTAPTWFYDVVKRSVLDASLSVEVHHSVLGRDPVF